MLALVGGEAGAELRQGQHGTEYVQFTLSYDEKIMKDYEAKVVRAAKEAAKEHKRDAVKARRSHRKNPHYMA
jgi:hypothetical protein